MIEKNCILAQTYEILICVYINKNFSYCIIVEHIRLATTKLDLKNSIWV